MAVHPHVVHGDPRQRLHSAREAGRQAAAIGGRHRNRDVSEREAARGARGDGRGDDGIYRVNRFLSRSIRHLLHRSVEHRRLCLAPRLATLIPAGAEGNRGNRQPSRRGTTFVRRPVRCAVIEVDAIACSRANGRYIVLRHGDESINSRFSRSRTACASIPAAVPVGLVKVRSKMEPAGKRVRDLIEHRRWQRLSSGDAHMKWVRRIGLVVLVVLVLVVIFLGTWDPLTAARAEAPPAHRYDVTIARDTFGVPHIFGASDPDVAYCIAYAHAEDDFSTLQEVLAMVRGRLGAMTGADGAKTDFALHFLDARATVDRDYDKQPADVRALLDGYASGLNKYAERHPDEVRLSRLFPVDGRDIATGFVMRSPFFFGLDATLGALVGDKPMPPETAPAEAAPNVTPVGPNGQENGSNAFVVAPKRTSDGATRMVSNSHQPWTGGVAWYELVVHSRTGWNFAGATFPGAPYPLLGHNATLGWTNTVNRPDLIDTYKLTLNAGGDAYRFDGQWRPLEKHLVWLRVKLWGPFVLPVPKYVYRAVQGPVIENKSGAYAIRYGGADQLKMVEEYYRLSRARTFGEWQQALAIQGVPATNFLYADAAGHIAYFYNASFPNRKPGYDYRKVLPGDTSADYAPGTVPWRMEPRNVDPASGFLVNANSTPFLSAGPGSELHPADWSPLLVIETDTTNRDNRALQLMLATPKIGADEMKRVKFDTGVAKTGWTAKWFADLMAVDPKGDARIGLG